MCSRNSEQEADAGEGEQQEEMLETPAGGEGWGTIEGFSAGK